MRSVRERQERVIDRLIDREWYDEYISAILSALRVSLCALSDPQESHVSDTEIIAIVNKASFSLGRAASAVVSSMVYQLLLLTNDAVARVVLLSLLQNIAKKCALPQLPAILRHFGYALKSRPVLPAGMAHAQALSKVFLELLRSGVLPLTAVSLLALFALSDAERMRPAAFAVLQTRMQREFDRAELRWEFPFMEEAPNGERMGGEQRGGRKRSGDLMASNVE